MKRPRLRHILILGNVVILMLPLAGIGVLRIYESALVRQTESALIAQGAFLAASYRASLLRLQPELPASYGVPLNRQWQADNDRKKHLRPHLPSLDLGTDPIRPQPAEPGRPVYAADNLAMVVGTELSQLMRETQAVTLAGIRLLDYRGIVVGSTGAELGLSYRSREEVDRALRGERVSLLRHRVAERSSISLWASISRDASVRVFAAMPVVYRQQVVAVVLLSRTPLSLGQAMYGKRYVLVLAALVMLGSMLLLSAMMVLTITRPVKALVRQAQKAVAGTKGAMVPLHHPRSQEIDELSQAVAQMAATLEQRADYISDFAAHVSHEFKTPLTGIRGAVELLHDHAEQMTATERDRFLSNIDGDALRLQTLVTRLLELAKADAGQIKVGECLLASVLESVQHDYAQRFDHQQLQLVCDADAEVTSRVVAIEAAELCSVLHTLLDNSLGHGQPPIQVTISAHLGEENQLHLRLADNGPGISTGNQQRVFDPFFTTNRAGGGTGLGLSVARSLLRAHGGDLQLLSGDCGCVFELSLPLI